MQNINEAFEDLDSRINELRDFKSYIPWQGVRTEYDISKIERNIYRFKTEAIPRIDISIQELKELQSLGISILNKHVLFDEWFQPISITAENVQNNELKRQEYYEKIQKEINFYITKLTELRNLQMPPVDENINHKQTITIGDDFKFPKLRTDYPEIPQTVLNKEQSALLFHYLMEKNIILPYDAKSISKIVSMLTGYSDETLRQNAFGHIHDIKNKTSNLETLKTNLLALIQEIDKDLK